MGVFRDAENFYVCVGELMDRAKLKLLPAVEPLYKVYPALLREKGDAALALKQAG